MSLEAAGDYLNGVFRQVEGWCGAGLWQVIQPLYDEIQKKTPNSPVAEIGVYKGKFFIGLAKTMGSLKFNTAIDVFDMQEFNLDGAGKGNLEIFQTNLALAAVPAEAVEIVRADSMALRRSDVDTLLARTGGFAMFSVDGCHLPEHTINDINIAMELTLHNGIIFVDDYYNANWPGVQEGVARMFFNGAPRFVPLVFTTNKLVMCHISHHVSYLKAVSAFLKEHHPATHVKRVRRFGYDTLTVVPTIADGRYIVS